MCTQDVELGRQSVRRFIGYAAVLMQEGQTFACALLRSDGLTETYL